MDPEAIAALVLAVMNLLTGGAWALDRRRLKGQTAEAEGSLAGVITVNEANRRAAQATLEAEKAAKFAALVKEMSDHHKDDEVRFRNIEAEIQRLRDHRHKIDTTVTGHAFAIAEMDRRITDTRQLANIDSSVRPAPNRP